MTAYSAQVGSGHTWNGLRIFEKILRRFSPPPPQPSESKPVNFNQKDTSPESLQNDVSYAVRIAENYLQYIQTSEIKIQNKAVLEVGPGVNFGSILVLAGYGARVMVSDRFLVPWDEEYHPKFYGLLKDWVKENMPDADTSPLDKILSLGGYPDNVIKLFATSLEELSGIADNSVDVVFSNAVLEHIISPPRAFQQMARISPKGAWGFHQVDFRDHRTMEQPLEFLLMNDAEFEREFEERHGECGNRWRHWEYLELFSQVGFEVIDFSPNIFADQAYLETFMPRIQNSSSKHISAALEDLKIVSGLITVKRS